MRERMLKVGGLVLATFHRVTGYRSTLSFSDHGVDIHGNSSIESNTLPRFSNRPGGTVYPQHLDI